MEKPKKIASLRPRRLPHRDHVPQAFDDLLRNSIFTPEPDANQATAEPATNDASYRLICNGVEQTMMLAQGNVTYNCDQLSTSLLWTPSDALNALLHASLNIRSLTALTPSSFEFKCSAATWTDYFSQEDSSQGMLEPVKRSEQEREQQERKHINGRSRSHKNKIKIEGKQLTKQYERGLALFQRRSRSQHGGMDSKASSSFRVRFSTFTSTAMRTVLLPMALGVGVAWLFDLDSSMQTLMSMGISVSVLCATNIPGILSLQRQGKELRQQQQLRQPAAWQTNP